MKIRSVAVLGAGAVGSYVIWGLSGKSDLKLGVVAEGERAGRLKQNGCRINGVTYRPQVWTPKEAHGVDLLVVALKYGALPGALESIREVTGENTVIMSLMNGVDSEELIAEKAGSSHMLYSLIKVASHKEGEGYCFDPDTTIGIVFGELSAPYDSDRVRAVGRAFCGYRDSFPSHGAHKGRDMEQIPAQCLQQSATGDLRRGRRLLSGQRTYEGNQ